MNGIGITEIRVFLVLLWASATLAMVTIVLRKFHFSTAFRIVGGLDIVFIVLTAWAYFSIWGVAWSH